MGIVNVTPDSFSDGGIHYSTVAAVDHALRLIEHGADIIDVGGESTRPGAAPVDETEEAGRVLPVIAGIRSRSGVAISIDTRKAAVARAAIEAGADIINDVSALRYDAAMLETAAAAATPVILMHMLGEPDNMQNDPRYVDVVQDVYEFFRKRLAVCTGAGITQLVIDPGIGFGKTLTHNLALLAGLPRMRELGVPLLIGVSRKSFLGQLTGSDVDQRLSGSLAAAVSALCSGAAIFRVHDVKEHRNALDVAWAILHEEEDEHAG
jgi:dihydropteroate synthase